MKYLKKKLLKWLLSDVDTLEVSKILKIGDNTVYITTDYIDYPALSSDPSASVGRLFYHSTEKVFKYSDGNFVAPIFPRIRMRSGRYFTSLANATALTTFTMSANVLYAIPFIPFEAASYDRIAINVTTAATGSARVGLYTDSGGYPGTLISGTDVGALDTSSTGVKENMISITLGPGCYFLAIVTNAAPTLRGIGVTNLNCESLGLDSTLSTTPAVGVSHSYTFGALPSTFPSASPSFLTSTVPLIALRRA